MQMYLYSCMDICVWEQVPTEAEEGIISTEIGVNGSSEPADVDARDQTWVLCKNSLSSEPLGHLFSPSC